VAKRTVLSTALVKNSNWVFSPNTNVTGPLNNSTNKDISRFQIQFGQF